jgi:16S rRNA (uracil1498-N3)-methyltransferase
MHRFYLSSAETQGATLLLTGREAHQALHVVRLRQGERVVVLDGTGHEFMCEVREMDRHQVALCVTQKNSIPPLPYQLVLAQAVTKAKAMDLIIQKATELGVHHIAPILSTRTVPHVEEESTLARLEKWRTAAVEAIKQCGSAWLPRIDAPVTPQAFLAAAGMFDLSLIATLQSDARHPRQHFEHFHREHQRAPKAICVWIGPEGDFTPGTLSNRRAHCPSASDLWFSGVKPRRSIHWRY